jgi:5-methylcytosine-specific restriction endonuclease McrA
MSNPTFRGAERKDIMFTLSIKYGWVCWYCNLPLRPNGKLLHDLGKYDRHTKWEVKEVALHIDHIVPKSCGGTDDIDNLALACEFCNHAKFNTDATTYLEWLDRVRTGDTWTPIRDGRKQ